MRHTSEIFCAGFNVEFGVIKTCAPSVKASPLEAIETMFDDSLLGWDEAGDPEAGDEFSSSGWDVADDGAEIEDKLSLSCWDEAGDPEAGGEFPSSGWDGAVDDAEIKGELSLSCWDNASLM